MSKKIVFIIAQHDFRDEEFLNSRAILESRGIESSIASKTRDNTVGRLGTVMAPDLAVAEVEPKYFDGLVVIGGPGVVSYFEDDEVLDVIRQFKKESKLIGASSLASSVLAAAGVLIGKTVTGLPEEEEYLRNKGGDYTGMPVEVDDNIITAKYPDDAKKFGEALAYYLEA